MGDKTPLTAPSSRGSKASGSSHSSASSKTAGTPSTMKKTLQVRQSSISQGRGNALVKDDMAPMAKKAPSRAAIPAGKKKDKTVAPKTRPAKEKTEPSKPVYDQDATKKFDAMLDGDLADLPSLPKSMVRIFLSSTFSDMRAERNALAREVYPTLRRLCAGYDLDFQVVDMRWGVTEDSQNDHSVEELCLLEVYNCQKVSRGPNFVLLSGDRYGFRPIPVEVDVQEFETLRSEAARLALDNRDLLDGWFKLDSNMIPAKYILQEIRSKFTFFGDHSPGCDENRQKDTAGWLKTYSTLQSLLRRSADAAYANKTLTADRRHHYYMAVTECEIEAGILNATEVDGHCLMYQREMRYLTGPSLYEENATRYIDVKKTGDVIEIDEEALRLREDLVQNKIPGKLKQSAIRSYSVNWKPGGVDPAHSDHANYLTKFCGDVISDVAGLVNVVVRQKESLIMTSNYYSDHEETIHHLRFCQMKCEAFCGQDKVLNAAKSYILDDSHRKPYIIHAPSGAGKTSIMAMIMKSIPKWLGGKDHLKLIRFLGTTPATINIYDVLFSVAGQLADAGDLIMSPVNYKSMKALVEFLPRYLRQISATFKMPVVILLDSVDQLYASHRAYSMDWLPTALPPNIKLILSTLPQEHGILDNLRKLLPDENCYVEVPSLPEATGKTIVEMYMKMNKRTLTETQSQLVLSVFRQTPTPLFLKVLLDEARKWHSYTSMAKVLLPNTVREAINNLFENLENKFGYTLVSHALGYITVGKVGLTEFEIEDVLSCDDKVLNEVYRFHDPPVEGIVRIPPVLWTRIHHDIKEYLVERLSYGKTTLNWYHRQFTETAEARYIAGNKDRYLHKTLTDIYLQDEGVRRTITLTNRNNLTITDADRQVAPQPFTPKNRRKLACLSYHAMRADTAMGLDTMKSKVFCNFKFLCTYIAAFSPVKLIEELGDFLQGTPDNEVAHLHTFVSTNKDDLSQQVRFAFSLLAYIKATDDQVHLQSLLADAKEYLFSQTSPLLIPTFASLSPRHDTSQALSSTLPGIESVVSPGSDSLLLKAISVEDEETPSDTGYLLYDTSTATSQPLRLPQQLPKHPAKLSWTGEWTYYLTQHGLQKLANGTGDVNILPFTDMVPNYDKNADVIQKFFTDKEALFGVLSFQHMLVLVDLMNMSCVQKLKIGKNLSVVESIVFANVKTSPSIFAIGQIRNSMSGDSQGPRNPSFVCQFKIGSEEPVTFIETDEMLGQESATLLAEDSWLLVSAWHNDSNDTEVKTGHNIVRFRLNPLVQESAMKITQPVSDIVGNPDLPHAVVLTVNGVLYLLDIAKGEIMLETKINVPVTSVEAIWEENIAILGSEKGTVTLYDLKTDKPLGAIPAHATEIHYITIVEDQLVTFDRNHTMKCWSVKSLVEGFGVSGGDDIDKVAAQTLLDETTSVTLGLSPGGDEVITATDEGYLKVWCLASQRLLRSFHIGMRPTVMHVTGSGYVVLLDHSQGKLLVLDCNTGENIFADLPQNVACFTINADGTCLYAVSSPKKGTVHVDLLNLKVKKIAKTIALQKGLTYVTLMAMLCETGRFLVLRSEITDEEYKTIAAMWKKMGSFSPQPHKYRFTAVDVSLSTGGLMPCYRQQTKIPMLGVIMSPYRGNTVMLTTRRWVVFWDIPTGKCDQKPSRGSGEKVGMMYRPGWLGQDAHGSSLALELSPNKECVAVGSEDGYVFIYSSDLGIPREKHTPATRHSAEVTLVVISGDSRWVASACRHSAVKLWDSRLGREQFSVRLDSEVCGMVFSPDSSHLVLYTGSQTTRVHIFSLHTGKAT